MATLVEAHLSAGSTMTTRTTDNADLEGFSKGCLTLSVFVVTLLIVVPLLVMDLYVGVVIVVVMAVLIPLSLKRVIKRKNNVAWRPSPNWRNQPDQTPMYTISSSVPLAPPLPRPPPPPLHRPSMSPPRSESQPAPPASTINHPVSQSRLSLSSQLSHAYYSHSSSFSSPVIASQTQHQRNSVSSPGARPSSTISFSASLPSGYSRSSFAGQVDVEAATQLAANLQPPAYPEVVEDDPGLPPHPYTTTTTDEGSGRVFGLSSDGLPSYEAAVSTWQPPADEVHRIPRDDGPVMND